MNKETISKLKAAYLFGGKTLWTENQEVINEEAINSLIQNKYRGMLICEDTVRYVPEGAIEEEFNKYDEMTLEMFELKNINDFIEYETLDALGRANYINIFENYLKDVVYKNQFGI